MDGHLLPVKLLVVVLCLSGIYATILLIRLGHPLGYAMLPASILIHGVIYYSASIIVLNIMAPGGAELDTSRHLFGDWGNALFLHTALEVLSGILVMVYLRSKGLAK